MPLLNIDFACLASNILPDHTHASFGALSVRARLAVVIAIADRTGKWPVRDMALHALAAMDAPAHVGLSAVKTALETCNMLVRVPKDSGEFLVAVSSTSAPQRQGFAEFAKWPRRMEDRWILTVTAHEVAAGLAAR